MTDQDKVHYQKKFSSLQMNDLQIYADLGYLIFIQ